MIAAGGDEPWALRSSQVHLWLLEPAVVAVAAVRAAAVSVLTDAEAARHERFAFAADRDAFLATRLLVRTVLSRYCQVEPRSLQFSLSASGKPELATPDRRPALRFNLSNTRGLVTCAVTRDRDIGVDVEATREVPPSIAEAVLTPLELETLYGVPERHRRRTFFAQWTLKESYIKATGDGLSMPLREFAIGLVPPRLLQHRRGIAECARWQFAALAPTPSHALALCVAASEPCDLDVVPRWLTAESILSMCSPPSAGDGLATPGDRPHDTPRAAARRART